MKINNEEFEEIVAQAIEALPEKFKARLTNVAIFVEDVPTFEQLKKAKLRDGSGLFGLFEGFSQGRNLNYGPVLPDRITIFRQSILRHEQDIEGIKDRIVSTVKHEIAHYFGSDEKGAAKASRISNKKPAN